MDNTMQLFTNQLFGNVTVFEINGGLWFIGREIATILGYSNPWDAMSKHVDQRDKDDLAIRDAIGREQKNIIINESGLYSLIFSSKLPVAVEFRHWVTSEVLPTMRKIGFDNATQLLQQEKFRLEQENIELKRQIDVTNALMDNGVIVKL